MGCYAGFERLLWSFKGSLGCNPDLRVCFVLGAMYSWGYFGGYF